MTYTIVRGGRVLDIAAGSAELADILIEGDTIREIGPPGCAAPEGATEILAARRLLHPGLVNAHTHGHGNLAKGMGDRWTLELLLTAAPWITGNRNLDDRYLFDPAGRGRDGHERLHRLLRPLIRVAVADRRGTGIGCPGLCRDRHARGHCADGRGPKLLRGDSRPDRGDAAGFAGARRRFASAAGRGYPRGDPRRLCRLAVRPRAGAARGGADHPAPLLG